MIIGGRLGAYDRAEVGSFTSWPSNGVGSGFRAHGRVHIYNGHTYVARQNIGTLTIDIYDYTTKSSIWNETDCYTSGSATTQYGQYIYVGYSLKASQKLTVRKVDLTDGSETTVWTDGAAGGTSGESCVAWDLTQGLIVFNIRNSGRRRIITIDPTDDTVGDLITDTATISECSASATKIYYATNTTTWKSMDWDGANVATAHTVPVSIGSFTGPNGLHEGNTNHYYIYDADASNAWNLGVKITHGIFLTNSDPYYLIGWETAGNSLKLWKLAGGSATTLLETLSGSYDIDHFTYPMFASSESFDSLDGDPTIIIGTLRSVLMNFPTKEHN